MKICVISSTVFPCPPPGYSGLEQIAYQISVGLAAKGHEVSLVAPEGSQVENLGLNLKLISCGPPGHWDERKAYSTYWQHLLGFDVIIDHSWQKWSYVLKMEGKLKSPVLGVIHAPVNTMYQSLPNVEKPCFVCISKDQLAHFEGLHSREGRYVHNGIDLSFYRSMGIPRSDRFLFLARFSSIKGPDLAIEACRRAGVGLDLVGDLSITGEPDFFEKCKSMADGKQIRIVGPASRGECVWWYSQAYCMLHPNQRYREPFGLALVEAMACGCPVIAWNFGACRETVAKHWLVNSLDELVKEVITQKERGESWYEKMNTRRYMTELAGRFSVENMITGYESLCKEAVETGGW